MLLGPGGILSPRLLSQGLCALCMKLASSARKICRERRGSHRNDHAAGIDYLPQRTGRRVHLHCGSLYDTISVVDHISGNGLLGVRPSASVRRGQTSPKRRSGKFRRIRIGKSACVRRSGRRRGSTTRCYYAIVGPAGAIPPHL